MRRMRWQDWVTLLAGIWLLVSPFAVRYSGDGTAMGNAVILGIAIIILSIVALSVRVVWEEWILVVLGIWLIVAPWLLRFTPDVTAKSNSVVVGIIVGLLALWSTVRFAYRDRTIANH